MAIGLIILVLMMDTAYIPTNDLKSPLSLPCSCMQCFHSVHFCQLRAAGGTMVYARTLSLQDCLIMVCSVFYHHREASLLFPILDWYAVFSIRSSQF